MRSSTKGKVFSGIVFTILEKIGAQGVSFVVSVVLARILLPSEYGIIALALIFVQICDVMVTYGFSNALVVNSDSDKLDFSTCFYFSLFLSGIMYILSWFVAPYFSKFFNQPQLTLLIRVLALRIPIVALNSVQSAYVQKKMDFKKFFYGTLIGTVTSGIIGIVMAHNKLGVWALAGQSLTNTIVNALALWFLVKWRPTLAFSYSRLKFIYSYGWKILATGLIDTLYSQLRDVVIGKKYHPSELAFYNRGMQFPTLANNIIEPTIANVFFPALAQTNKNKEGMISVLRRSVKTISFIIFPFFIILGCVAKPLITILLTDKWLPSVEFLQIGCIGLAIRPLQVLNNTMIRASGNSGLLLKLDIYKKTIGVCLLILSIPLGIMGIVWSMVITNYISTLINIMPNRKYYKYGYRDQLRDIMPNLILSFSMGIIIYLFQFIIINEYILFATQVILGIIIYLILSKITKNESFRYLVNTIQDILTVSVPWLNLFGKRNKR